MIPGLPCDMTDISCWKKLSMETADDMTDMIKEKMQDVEDNVADKKRAA